MLVSLRRVYVAGLRSGPPRPQAAAFQSAAACRLTSACPRSCALMGAARAPRGRFRGYRPAPSAPLRAKDRYAPAPVSHRRPPAITARQGLRPALDGQALAKCGADGNPPPRSIVTNHLFLRQGSALPARGRTAPIPELNSLNTS